MRQKISLPMVIVKTITRQDDLVGTITTDDTGIAQLGDLPVGKYYVKEVANRSMVMFWMMRSDM